MAESRNIVFTSVFGHFGQRHWLSPFTESRHRKSYSARQILCHALMDAVTSVGVCKIDFTGV
jgi:hypothetical protein